MERATLVVENCGRDGSTMIETTCGGGLGQDTQHQVVMVMAHPDLIMFNDCTQCIE